MPSKKRKYNARFPAGRIKKIMQTDEEVGKVAQAVPIIISRTLELFVESLLSKAMQVTVARNAKTLSPSHVKQCILAEARFDFLRDLVKNIPDVSAAEEKELQMSAESSPNSSRFSDTAPPRRIAREDSNSSSSCDVRMQSLTREPSRETVQRENTRESIPADLPRENVRETLKRTLSAKADNKPRIETVTNKTASTTVVSSEAIDLTKKKEPVRTANFYQETLVDPVQHKSVIQVNPTYNMMPQPSTSNNYASLTPVEPAVKIDMPKGEIKPYFYLDVRQNNNISNITNMTPPRTPVTPILNIDFSKNIAKPEIKVLDTTMPNIPPVAPSPHIPMHLVRDKPKLQRQNSKTAKPENKKEKPPPPVNIDHINSGNLQIDEDYDT